MNQQFYIAVNGQQTGAIDNTRLLKKIGQLNKEQREKLKSNLRVVLDL